MEFAWGIDLKTLSPGVVEVDSAERGRLAANSVYSSK
jgi:hypothetical protein